jgi:hypothetical protein
MKNYMWRGITIQLEDSDLSFYPGAVPVETKAEKAPANKAKKTVKNKAAGGDAK